MSNQNETTKELDEMEQILLKDNLNNTSYDFKKPTLLRLIAAAREGLELRGSQLKSGTALDGLTLGGLRDILTLLEVREASVSWSTGEQQSERLQIIRTLAEIGFHTQQSMDWAEKVAKDVHDIGCKNDALTTELEALRRDKERLDKMEELFLSVSWNKRSQVWIVQQMNQVVRNIGSNHTMRQAMDTAIGAAMKKETK